MSIAQVLQRTAYVPTVSTAYNAITTFMAFTPAHGRNSTQ